MAFLKKIINNTPKDFDKDACLMAVGETKTILVKCVDSEEAKVWGYFYVSDDDAEYIHDELGDQDYNLVLEEEI